MSAVDDSVLSYLLPWVTVHLHVHDTITGTILANALSIGV